MYTDANKKKLLVLATAHEVYCKETHLVSEWLCCLAILNAKYGKSGYLPGLIFFEAGRQ
jgi:hypothetical protein